MPTVQKIGDSMTIDFHAEMVHATLDRFRESRGDVSAELTLRTSSPGITPHLHRSRWNLCSMTQRDQLARMLRQRFPVDGVDWPDLIEQTAHIALEVYRAGEPVVLVGRLDRTLGPRYLVDPLVLANEINLHYALGGAGKTTLATALALTAQAHVPLLGLPTPYDPLPALFLDFETNADTIDGIVKRLAAGAGVRTVPELAYRRCVGALADQAEDLRRLVAERRVGFVVVDSLGAACGGEPESAEVTLRLMNAVRSLGVTALLIDHIPRNGEEPFGSVYKVNAARAVWRIRGQQETGEDEIRVGLFNTKANLSRKHRPLGWRLRFDNAALTTTFTRIDPADVEEFRPGLSVADQILAALRTGARPTKELVDALDAKPDTVDKTLRRLRDRGRVVKVGDDWGLVHHE